MPTPKHQSIKFAHYTSNIAFDYYRSEASNTKRLLKRKRQKFPLNESSWLNAINTNSSFLIRLSGTINWNKTFPSLLNVDGLLNNLRNKTNYDT